MKFMSGKQVKSHSGSLLCAPFNKSSYTFGGFSVRVFDDTRSVAEQDQRFITFSEVGVIAAETCPTDFDDFIKSGESFGPAAFSLDEATRNNFSDDDVFLVLEQSELKAMVVLLEGLIRQAPSGKVEDELNEAGGQAV